VRIEPFRIILNDETLDKMFLFKEAYSHSTKKPSFELNRNVTFGAKKDCLPGGSAGFGHERTFFAVTVS